SRLYLQCRFNNEILTTDPVPFDEEPVWDTDLAWDISHKPLAFLRTQRAKLKLVCYAIDALNRRVQVGYVMLDLRTAASAVSSDLNAPLESGKENPSVWYPLLNVNTTKKTPMSVFKPELKIAFVIIQKVAATGSILPKGSSKQKRLKKSNIPSSAASPKPMLISSPKAIRIQLYPDGATSFSYSSHETFDFRQPPSPAYQFNQNQTLFTTTSGLPIELTPTGCYQIGFNGPNWLLNFTIAFAENLSILRPPSLDSNAVSTTPVEGYYFSYSFLGNTVTTTPFPNLSKPSFPSERISFRIRASEHDFSQFLGDVEVLVVSLCQEPGSEVIGYAEVPLMSVMAGANEKSRDLESNVDEMGVVETVVTFYDAKQELPVSVDGKVAGLGISVIVSPDFQSDLMEAETGGLQRHLLGGAETEGYEENEFEEYDQQEAYDEQVKPVVSGSPALLGRRLVDPRHGAESPDLMTDMPVPQSPPVQTSFQRPALSQTEEFAKYTQQNQIPAMNAAKLQMDQISGQRQPDLSKYPAPKNQSLPAPVPKPAPWHQYRFSIDLRSIRGIHPAHGPIFLKYSYPPFGTTSPITTYPPVKPTNPITTTSTHKPAGLDLPNAFCAFEFVMGAERLLTYLEAVPLAIEVWNTDAYEKNVQIGLATVDLSAVCLKEQKVVHEPVQVRLQSLDLVVGVVANKSDGGGREEDGNGGGRIVKIADLRVVLALEDFGAVDDLDLLDETVAPVANSAIPMADNAHSKQELWVDDPRDAERGPSPTFVKFSHGAGVKSIPETTSKLAPSQQIRQRETTPPPQPASPTPSSIHETQEYRAALEVALWKRQEMASFKTHLSQLQTSLVEKLTAEFSKRDSKRVDAIAARVRDLERVETATRDLLFKLEGRDSVLKKGEEDLARRKEEVERYFRRKDDETKDTARRLGDEFKARVEMERVKALEAEAGRIRVVRERDDLEVKLRRLETEFEQFRKNMGEATVAAIKNELASVVAGAAARERRAESLEASKRHYKAQWIRTLRDLAKTKKLLQQEIEDRLRKSQNELDTVKMRLLAKEELGSVENERKMIDTMRREIAHLKSMSGAKEEKSKENTSSVAGGKENSESGGILRETKRQNLDPRIQAEVERLVKERDSLVDSGLYSRHDRLIRELDVRVGNLLK
ncbi:Cep120 protein-domain-containing protein, partial [Chytriomyces cf. hyalinus JEL632]